MTNPANTIAILMPGDMGHGVGRVLNQAGYDVVTCLTGRSDHTRELAKAAGFRDIGNLNALVTAADLILSILPPAAALDQAKAVSQAMKETGARPVYADCNAVSPNTVKNISRIINSVGGSFIDGGIIGLAPGKGPATRFYISGPDLDIMSELDGKGIEVLPIGPGIGRASALKMTYAGLTKGTFTLHTAVLLAARQSGVLDELLNEFEFSQKVTKKAMETRIPRLPADSERWIGEMQEIAATFADVGVPSGFHEGAAEICHVMAQTRFASETRQTMDTGRTLAEALEEFAKHLKQTD